MSLCFHYFLPHTVDSYPDLFEPSHAYNDLVCQAEHLSCEGGRHLEAHPGRGLAGARWAGGQRSLRLELAEQTRPRQLRWSGHKLRLLMESLTRHKHDGKDGLEQGDLLVHDAIMHILRNNRFRVPGTILLTLHLYQIHILLFLSTTGLSGLLASPSLKLCASSTLIRSCSWACVPSSKQRISSLLSFDTEYQLEPELGVKGKPQSHLSQCSGALVRPNWPSLSPF